MSTGWDYPLFHNLTNIITEYVIKFIYIFANRIGEKWYLNVVLIYISLVVKLMIFSFV